MVYHVVFIMHGWLETQSVFQLKLISVQCTLGLNITIRVAGCLGH